MKTKDIKQSVVLSCSPREAFEAWVDGKTHGDMIGAEAKIDPTVGGLFDIWDGYLIGKTLEIDKEKLRIVQEWRDDSTEWPEGYFSRITVQFEDFEGKTKVHFLQTGIPEEYADSIAEGWKEYYWDKMEKYFEEKNRLMYLTYA